MSGVLNEPGPASMLFAIWAAPYRTPARFVALVALLLPWTTTGVIFALIPLLVAFSFVDLRWLPPLLLPPFFLPLARVVVPHIWGLAPGGPPGAEGAPQKGPVLEPRGPPLPIPPFGAGPRGKGGFSRSRGLCALLRVYSLAVATDPVLSLKLYLSRGPYKVESGVAVRNYIDQSQEFGPGAIPLSNPILRLFRKARTRIAMLFAVFLLGFLLNMIFVVVSRTALVTLPILVVVFALLHLRWRTVSLAVSGMALVAVALWSVSPHLRATVAKFQGDYEMSAQDSKVSGMGSRLEYWRKSLGFIAEAPLIGHGTGSIRGLFAGVAADADVDPLRGQIVSDPHNQTLSVAVQWGVAGVVVLYALWFAHLLMFRGEGLACWVGLLVVVQNMPSSLINSHLSYAPPGGFPPRGRVPPGAAGGTRRRWSEKRADAVPDQGDARQKQQAEHDIAEMLVAQRVIDARAGPGADQRAGECDHREPDHLERDQP